MSVKTKCTVCKTNTVPMEGITFCNPCYDYRMSTKWWTEQETKEAR